jgi:hypothetical protein
LLEADGYATLYGKHGVRTIRVGRRTWEVLQQLAAGKELDDRIVAIDDIVTITDERIQILTAAAAGLKEVALAPRASSRAWLACASARRPGGHDSRHARPCFTEHDRPLPQFVADRRVESVLEITTVRFKNFTNQGFSRAI